MRAEPGRACPDERYGTGGRPSRPTAPKLAALATRGDAALVTSARNRSDDHELGAGAASKCASRSYGVAVSVRNVLLSTAGRANDGRREFGAVSGRFRRGEVGRRRLALEGLRASPDRIPEARGGCSERSEHRTALPRPLPSRTRTAARGQQKRREGSSQRMTRGYETLANDNAKRARARALPENVETRRWTAPTATGLPAPRHRCDVAFSFWVCSSASYCPAASCAISGRRRRHRVRRCVAYTTAAT